MSTTPAQRLVEEIERLVPQFLEDPVDREMSKGNAAACVIDAAGRLHGRVFGEDKARGRGCFLIASRKVSQVWVTGCATGRFEELVFTGQLDEHRFGLSRPDFIGWLGGVALELDDGTPLAAAFSGFRGEKDVEIVHLAAAAAGGIRVKTQ